MPSSAAFTEVPSGTATFMPSFGGPFARGPNPAMMRPRTCARFAARRLAFRFGRLDRRGPIGAGRRVVGRHLAAGSGQRNRRLAGRLDFAGVMAAAGRRRLFGWNAGNGQLGSWNDQPLTDPDFGFG